MYTYVVIAAGVLTVGVVLALALGLFNFAQEGRDRRRASNKMMRWRVGLQFGVVLLLLVLLLLGAR